MLTNFCDSRGQILEQDLEKEIVGLHKDALRGRRVATDPYSEMEYTWMTAQPQTIFFKLSHGTMNQSRLTVLKNC